MFVFNTGCSSPPEMNPEASVDVQQISCSFCHDFKLAFPSTGSQAVLIHRKPPPHFPFKYIFQNPYIYNENIGRLFRRTFVQYSIQSFQYIYLLDITESGPAYLFFFSIHLRAVE